MPSWNNRTKWLCALAAAALYFALAGWSRYSFVDLAPKGRIVVQLTPPFDMDGHVAIGSSLTDRERLQDFADDEHDEAAAMRSPVVLYENGRPLGPAHNNYADIRNLGMGRFAHWRRGFVFTASDNSNPNTNKRVYWAVVPDYVPKGRIVMQLMPPFQMSGHVAILNPASDKMRGLADDEYVEDDRHSPVVIYEDGRPLGPAHNNYADIRDLGMGRFSYWRIQGFVFTASDNSDPNTNGRLYWAAVP